MPRLAITRLSRIPCITNIATTTHKLVMLTNTQPMTQATLITIRLPTITNAKMYTTLTTLRPMKTSTWAPSSKIQRACMVVGMTQRPRLKVNRLANRHLPRPSHPLLLSPRKSPPNQHLSQNLPIPSQRNPLSPKNLSQKNPNSQRKNQRKSQRRSQRKSQKRSQRRSSQRRLQLSPRSSPSQSLARIRPMSPRIATRRPQSRSRPSPRRREPSSMRRSRTATWRSS